MDFFLFADAYSSDEDDYGKSVASTVKRVEPKTRSPPRRRRRATGSDPEEDDGSNRMRREQQRRRRPEDDDGRGEKIADTSLVACSRISHPSSSDGQVSDAVGVAFVHSPSDDLGLTSSW